MKKIERKLTEKLLFALENNPVVFMNGPRQAGKSTLAQAIAATSYPADYVTFDNATQLAAAAFSPESFLSERSKPVIIDEVQMLPELFRALKMVVDSLRQTDKESSHGRFLLTGSANIMALPKLSDPLVGRMSVKTLYPFSCCETLDGTGNFLTQLFSGDFNSQKIDISLHEAIRSATYPEISGKTAALRTEWFEGYLTTLLQRDVKMLAELEKISRLPIMLRILASRAGNLMNDAEIARDVGLNPVTSKQYRGILQAMFLSFDVPPWYRNITKRLVKSPKGYLIDTLLLCHILDWQLDDIKHKQPHLYGHIIENFVATELTKLLSFSDLRAQLFHFRTSDNKEVDFVLERPNGQLAAIEVKASSNIDGKAFNGIKVLQAETKKDFICGIVLYLGNEVIPFGDNLYAVPLHSLWV